ncbi:MAG: hypothetical protein RBS80_22625 [Thermoguttaceae bacterium]|jgi:hypothetical protein|nr:hypothetical protein [Thermoguttaceae bacterium]
MTNQPPPKTTKKLQALAQMAADLRQGKHFEITRLTVLKSLCSDSEAAVEFALHLAKLTLKKMKAKKRSGRPLSKTHQEYQRLATAAVRAMSQYAKEPTTEAASTLHDLLTTIWEAQSDVERQQWGPVRIIKSQDLLVIETALECLLRPDVSHILAYDLARRYAERYNSRYGTGLIPESAPMVEDIAEFWGKHFLGRGWKKQMAGYVVSSQ